ncbi:MAG: hypothetical protein ACJ77N_14615 [Chloroflexota bacterium]
MAAASAIPSGWRRFAAERYRPFHTIAVGQSIMSALGSDAMVIPFVVALGAPAPLVTLIGTLPIAGSVLQAANPRLLARFDGDLRRLTVFFVAAELRGFVLALLAGAAALRLLDGGLAIALVAATFGLGQALALMSGANIALWGAIVLPDDERRLVAPRAAVLAAALAAVLLVPTSVLLDSGLATIGLWIYAVIFLTSGIGGLLVNAGVRRLARPGRVRPLIGEAQAGAPIPASFGRFLRVSVLASTGQGLVPYASVYALTILHSSPGFAVALGAVGAAASLASSVVVGSFLAEGSASRVLRVSLVGRVVAAAFALAAFPANPYAIACLLTAQTLFYAAGSAGVLATNERLFRLAPRDARVQCQGRFVGATAVGVVGGSGVQAGVLAVAGPASHLGFAALWAGAGLLRALAAVRTEVSPSWRPYAAAAEGRAA